MKRRQFLQRAGVGLATAAIASPAIAQSTPAVHWRLATSFPKNLDTLYGACEMFSKAIADMSDQKFQVQVFGPGEIVPSFQVFDAVSNNTVEMGNSGSYYYIGKDLSFAFGTAVPFGLNTREMNSWLAYGGGTDLLNELYGKYNVLGLPFGNTTAQMGGWFRKEIKTVEDLKGLKFRCGGMAGQVLAKLGVVPQQIPPADIYPALEKGTIDAAGVDRPVRRRKARLRQDCALLLLPGLVGRFCQWAHLHQHNQVGRVAQDLPAYGADSGRPGRSGSERKVRQQECAGHQAARGSRGSTCAHSPRRSWTQPTPLQTISTPRFQPRTRCSRNSMIS